MENKSEDSGRQVVKQIVNFESTRAKLNSQKDDINKYGNYIYYAGLGLGCVTLLIVLLYFLGLLFVILCGDKASSCDQRTGTNFLMAGVGFTFIFALFLMLLTTLLFIVGAPLYSVTCRYTANLSDPALTKEFDLLLDAMEIDFGYNLTLSGFMAACGRDESIYNAARLGDRINIVEYLNISKYPFLTDAIDNLRNKTFDIGEVNILSDDTRNKLDKLINGSLDNINFTSFETQVNRNLTAGDLDILVAQIRDAVAKLKQVYPTTAVELQTQANKLEDIQTNTVKGLKVQKANLGIAVDKLKTILTDNGGFTEDTRRLLKNLQDAEEKIKKKGNHLLTGIVAHLAENVLTEISRSLTGIAKKLTNDLGRCKEPLDIVQSTIDIGCVSVLGPFNGLWFSLGWFIFFSIFGIIFAVKLVGVVHAVEGPSAG
ncbi:Prominin-1-A [Lamellibrachia satsuma]|nr:Prominin-1-A [Lamellibrachia satsuma]